MLLLLLSCVGVRRALGMRTTLEGLEVESIEATLGMGESAVCPGKTAPLVVWVRLADGNLLLSEGAGGGKVKWKSFAVAGEGVSFDERTGELTLDADPAATWKKPATLRVFAVEHPGVEATLEINARYNCDYVADFSGDAGAEGADGSSGNSGSNGPDSPSSGSSAAPGGHGQDGSDGGDGDDGKDAEDAESVSVQVATVEGSFIAVSVRGESSGRTSLVVINPENGGSVSIRADGGDGGNGGDGGRGGEGGDGGLGNPGGNGGDGGDGGDGGRGGDGGNGGAVTVVYDPSTKAHLAAITISNRGGAGGAPGAAGLGGEGGSAWSGGNAGRDGDNGSTGSGTGRPGRDGAKATFTEQAVKPPDLEPKPKKKD